MPLSTQIVFISILKTNCVATFHAFFNTNTHARTYASTQATTYYPELLFKGYSYSGAAAEDKSH